MKRCAMRTKSMKDPDLVHIEFEHIVALLVLLHVSAMACAAELYRWTDKDGRVHYSDAVPEAQKGAAKTVDLTNAHTTNARRQEAEVRYAQDKSALQRPSPTTAPAPLAAKPAPDTTEFPAGRKACEEEWRKYRVSEACFASYRNATGGLKPEAFNKCIEMKMPALCR